MDAHLVLDRAAGLNEPPRTLAVAAGQSIQQALAAAGVRLPQAAIALVNGQTCDLSTILQPGDQVRFLLQISGGAAG
jgi:sulfur carrier protein ThiS